MSITETNRDTVTGALQSLMTGDIKAFMGALHEDVEVHQPDYLPYGGVFRGRAGFLELLKTADGVLDMSTMKLVTAIGGDDRTVLLMTANVQASGKQVHITEHWVLEDGLVREVRVFWDSAP